VEKNTIYFLGIIDEEFKENLELISQKTWGNNVEHGGSYASLTALENLPLANMSGSSPVFLIGENLLKEGNLPNYKKVSESKGNCLVGVVTFGNPISGYVEKGNHPDFFIDLRQKIIEFYKIKKS
jgi:hypothetical protein